MPNSTREALGWSEERWTKVKGATEQAVARTAKCRQVVPKGPEQIGEKSVVVPQVRVAPPLGYDADVIATPVHVFVNLQLDDPHVDDELAVIRLVEASAASLGVLEDQEVIQGGPARAPRAGGAPPQSGRVPRNTGLTRAQFSNPAGAFTNIAAAAAPVGGAAGGIPTGNELLTAIATAKAALEAAERPGTCGLLLHPRLLAILGLPPVAGATPLIQQVEQIIGSSEIVGTSALDGTFAPNAVAAILFRLEPPAVDTVHTMLPTLTFLGRNNGNSNLQIEEEIAVRILDQTAIHHIEY